MSIRDQLDPHIREIGIRELARRAADKNIQGIHPPMLSTWLSGGDRRLNDTQIDAICEILGLEIQFTKT